MKKPIDPHVKLTEALVTSFRRRQIVGSRNVAIATAALIQNLVRSAKYTTIDELLALIKMVGRKLVEANPLELAIGNIIRRILRLIREEYRAAATAHLSAPPSAPETPFLGPTTPGLHAPSSHYLSNELSFTSPSGSPRPNLDLGGGMERAASLSNFVVMRHSRAQSQLERSGSLVDLSTSTSNLFMSPTRNEDQGVRMVDLKRVDSGEFMRQSGKLKPVLLQAIEEVQGELESTHEDVAKGAREHIHGSEIILTLGHSKTVEAFLKHAYRDRKFTVVVAESAPSYLGHSMATSLSSASIPTLLIPDSSIHALMPRITKLVLSCHTVLANGGLFALSGTLSACLAARAYSKPVMIVTGQFKFAPAWNSYHDYSAVDFQGPGRLWGDRDELGVGDKYSLTLNNLQQDEKTTFVEVRESGGKGIKKDGGSNGDKGEGGGGGVQVMGSYYDYVKPELINLFVTNEGDHSPSYIYRLIKEAYDDEDVEL
ncbi:translation initiation factor eIF-2B subunit beta [Tremella mesenterica]|uniref:Translation initiation factor eIF2B subunit beta n=1 Tax=Tremella mesenterica TaxID=5217 RepID=A0A4Q1BCN1_TREME|nr:translation initiation factor eIF-2B subunit beta [Tremella mesenterica]